LDVEIELFDSKNIIHPLSGTSFEKGRNKKEIKIYNEF